MVKESNPIEVEYFEIANRYHKELELCSWVKKVINNGYIIIIIVKSRCKKSNKYTFGIKVPTTAEEA